MHFLETFAGCKNPVCASCSPSRLGMAGSASFVPASSAYSLGDASRQLQHRERERALRKLCDCMICLCDKSAVHSIILSVLDSPKSLDWLHLNVNLAALVPYLYSRKAVYQKTFITLYLWQPVYLLSVYFLIADVLACEIVSRNMRHPDVSGKV